MAETSPDKKLGTTATLADRLDAEDARLEIEYRETFDNGLLKKGRRNMLEALEMTPENHPKLWSRFKSLSKWYYRSYEISDKVDDLNFAITFTEKAQENIAKEGTDEYWFTARNLSQYLAERFDITEDEEDLDQAITLADKIVHLTPLGDKDELLPMFNRLSGLLRKKFRISNDVGNLDAAVTVMEEAKCLAPSDYEFRCIILTRLSESYWERFTLNKNLEDADRAAEQLEETLLETPDDVCLCAHLGRLLSSRCKLANQDARLDRSIELLQYVISPKAHEKFPDESDSLEEKPHLSLASNLIARFKSGGDLSDLDSAISVLKQAMDNDISSSCAANVRLKLSQYLCDRWEICASAQDLDEALQLATTTFENADTEDIDEVMEFVRISRDLGEALQSHEDYVSCLNCRINFLEVALQLRADSDEDYAKILGILRDFYRYRFRQTRSMDDLSQAMYRSEELLDRTAETMDVQDLIDERAMLAESLMDRYNQNGRSVLEDVNKAIIEMEKVTELADADNQYRRYYLSQLAQYHTARFLRAGSKDDLEICINIHQELLKSLEDDSGSMGSAVVTRTDFLTSLAEALRLRSRYSWENGLGSFDEDLSRAIEYAEEALRIDDQEVNTYHNLASCYSMRFQQADEKDAVDLDLRIKALTTATELTNESDEGKAHIWSALAHAYYDRAFFVGGGETQEHEDLKQAVLCMEECKDDPECTVLQRWEALNLQALIHLKSNHFKDALEIYQDAVNLVPDIVMRSASYADQYHHLKFLGGGAGEYIDAGLSVGTSPEYALEILELCRGVISNFALAARADALTLDAEMSSAFTDAFSNWEQLRASLRQIQNEETDLAEWLSTSQKCYRAELEVRNIIREVRESPETGHFLRPPSIRDVREVLGDDSVVVFNLGDDTCHAFLINNKLDEVKSLELEGVTRAAVDNWVKRLRASRPLIHMSMLEWLWTKLTCPVLKELGFDQTYPGSKLPRVIWIPTGPLCHLPIHAAGMHDLGTMTVLDRVVSSYSSSLKAFVVGRRREQAVDVSSGLKALLVGVSEATCLPGLSRLPFVVKEVQQLGHIFKSLNLGFTSLAEPNIRDVMQNMSGRAIFHFAGHGCSDPLEPSLSGIVMRDGLLTVSDLMDATPQSETPFLAFLSACSVGAIDVDAIEDEAIHLISACQLLGFRHVVGTQWQVSDNTCLSVSESFYTELARNGMTDDSVCRALHHALLHLRDQWVKTGKIHMRGGNMGADAGGNADNYEEPQEDTASELFGGAESNGEGEGTGRLREHRDARLISRKRTLEKLVTADWIPYIHYGP